MNPAPPIIVLTMKLLWRLSEDYKIRYILNMTLKFGGGAG